MVEAAIAEGIYVIVDWHDNHAEEHAEEAEDFFSMMAQRFGNYPNVIFEIYYRPMLQSWADVIKPYHERIIPVIRRFSDNLIVLGTRSWSQDVDIASKDPVSGVNLAYAIHFFAATHGHALRDKASTALANGAITDKEESCAALRPGSSASGGWTEGSLTDS